MTLNFDAVINEVESVLDLIGNYTNQFPHATVYHQLEDEKYDVIFAKESTQELESRYNYYLVTDQKVYKRFPKLNIETINVQYLSIDGPTYIRMLEDDIKIDYVFNGVKFMLNKKRGESLRLTIPTRYMIPCVGGGANNQIISLAKFLIIARDERYKVLMRSAETINRHDPAFDFEWTREKENRFKFSEYIDIEFLTSNLNHDIMFEDLEVDINSLPEPLFEKFKWDNRKTTLLTKNVNTGQLEGTDKNFIFIGNEDIQIHTLSNKEAVEYFYRILRYIRPVPSIRKTVCDYLQQLDSEFYSFHVRLEKDFGRKQVNMSEVYLDRIPKGKQVYLCCGNIEDQRSIHFVNNLKRKLNVANIKKSEDNFDKASYIDREIALRAKRNYMSCETPDSSFDLLINSEKDFYHETFKFEISHCLVTGNGKSHYLDSKPYFKRIMIVYDCITENKLHHEEFEKYILDVHWLCYLVISSTFKSRQGVFVEKDRSVIEEYKKRLDIEEIIYVTDMMIPIQPMKFITPISRDYFSDLPTIERDLYKYFPTSILAYKINHPIKKYPFVDINQPKGQYDIIVCERPLDHRFLSPRGILYYISDTPNQSTDYVCFKQNRSWICCYFNDKTMEDEMKQKYLYYSFVSVMAIFKNESHIMKEWISFYRWQTNRGCIYMIDNGSTDNMDDVKWHESKGHVKLFSRPKEHAQEDHYNEIYDTIIKKNNLCSYLVLVDLDEFMYGRKDTIYTILKSTMPDTFIVHWKMFGTDGHISQPKSVIFGSDKRKTTEECQTNENFDYNKGIINVKTLDKKIDVHLKPNENRMDDIFGLNHYPLQSEEFFKNVKMTRGDVRSKKHNETRDQEYFDEYNANTVVIDKELQEIILSNYHCDPVKIINEKLAPEGLISRAFYDKKDVTKILNKIILEGKKTIPYNAIFGDSSPGKRKKLTVVANHKEIVLDENSRLDKIYQAIS